MVFLANLGINLHVCLCGDLQVASAQTLDFLDIGQKSSFPDWKLGSTAKSFPDGHQLGISIILVQERVRCAFTYLVSIRK
ncbi:hypothetical protein TRIP_B240006 [uncultured Desulfatiglans sp.]|nr:hypothetical protein TRIP_B240006 [uncultured Desulfatiglans sp.]